jgi:hypothetical protein
MQLRFISELEEVEKQGALDETLTPLSEKTVEEC